MTDTKRRRTKGTGEVRLVGRIWKIRYTGPDGQRVQESSGSTRKKDAVKKLNQRLGEIEGGRWIGPSADNLKFGDLENMLTDHYHRMRSEDRAKRALKHQKRHLGFYKATKITTSDLTRYVKERRLEAASDSTIKYELAVLKKGFNLAIRSEILTKKPAFPILKIENTRTGFFERHEIESLLDHLPGNLRGLVQFMYFTGWRKNEALTRQWHHVDFDAGVIRLEPGETKNAKGRTFPFTTLPELKAVLDQQLKYTKTVQRRTGQVIPWVFHREGMPIREYRGAWQAACIRAKLAVPKVDDDGKVVMDKNDKPIMLPIKIPHDFRRTAVRNMERAGVSRSVAKALIGHETDEIYERYAITNESDLREGVDKLANMHSREPQEEQRGAVAGQIG